MSAIKVPVVEKILNANDKMAEMNRAILDKHKVLSLNLMASPGAGKTSFIIETIKRIKDQYQLGVIEGDTAPVTIDADKITSQGMPAVQINTGGGCHLEAYMVSEGIKQLPLSAIDLMIIENVGNLVCPASWDIGTHLNVLISSIPEGDDKPYKYPNIYRGLEVLIINKTDLLPYIIFDMDYFRKGVEQLNPGLVTFPISCKTGDGMDAWITWLSDRIEKQKSR
jgi:hydrogenase nickel incorporation protein HypB